MSDKPIIQQQLSETLSSLILRVPRESVMAFIATFWETICGEWHGIDRLRYNNGSNQQDTTTMMLEFSGSHVYIGKMLYNISDFSQLISSRLDKFYFLLRRFLSYSFRMLKENAWDLETIEEFTTVMINGPLK
jgi:ribosomal RNA-processing protein 1